MLWRVALAISDCWCGSGLFPRLPVRVPHLVQALSPAASPSEGCSLGELFLHSWSHWMSDTSALEAEVQLLRLELAALTARVLRLEAEKEADQGSQNIHSPRITVSYHSPCVGSPIAELPPFPGSSGQQLSSAAAAAAVAPVDLAGDSIVESVGRERLTIAREAGQFLRRCLEGVIRGTSGQDRIQAPSRCYILAKDISGKTYNSVKADGYLGASAPSTAGVDNRLVVAFRADSWSRTTAKRVLPRGSLIKPQLVSVEFLDREAAEHEGAASLGPKKIWVAILAAPFESRLVFDPEQEPGLTTYPFSVEGPLSLPVAESLALLAEQHFGSFLSAASEAAEPVEPDQGGLEARLDTLERTIKKLTDNLGGLAAVPIKANPKCPPGLPAPTSTAAMADMDVVRKPTQNKENPFDDSEDEEQEHGLQPDGGAEGVAPVDPMVTAIGKLTQIAAQLATQKKTRKRWKTFWTGLGQLQAQSPGAVQAHDPPPMVPFQQHLLPSESEQPYTKLIDSRWSELFVSKLADIDSLNEKKRRLGARRAATPGADAAPPPKADPKVKGKGKEKGKGKQGAEGHVDPPATQWLFRTVFCMRTLVLEPPLVAMQELVRATLRRLVDWEVSFFGNVPSHLQKGLTSMVICMNWLHLGQPYKIPSHFNPRERLSGEQRATIHRLLRLMTPWSESLPVIAADMGRTAAKVENVEMTIELLKRSTATAVARLGSSRETVGEVPEMRSASLLGEVQLAKKIESQRIKFAGRPSFDPSPLLDEASRKIYCNPLAQAMPPEESMQEPPRVNARGDRKEDCFVNSIIQADRKLLEVLSGAWVSLMQCRRRC
eukprot:symbB.v1.2.039079.t1/scaffold6337.1/size18942/1